MFVKLFLLMIICMKRGRFICDSFLIENDFNGIYRKSTHFVKVELLLFVRLIGSNFSYIISNH